MEELKALLNNISDSYYDFVSAMIHYAKKKKTREDALLGFIKSNPDATSSDVIEFVSNQEDFFEDAAYMKVS